MTKLTQTQIKTIIKQSEETGFHQILNDTEQNAYNMEGGKYTITNIDKFIDTSVEKISNKQNWGLVFCLNDKVSDKQILSFDLDFKDEQLGSQSFNISRDIIKIVKEMYGDEEDFFEPLVEKNISSNNIHIYFNKIFLTSSEITEVRKIVNHELSDKYNNDKIIDYLSQGKTLIRLPYFNKYSIKEGGYVPDSYYVAFDIYKEKEIKMGMNKKSKLNGIRKWFKEIIPTKFNENYEDYKDFEYEISEKYKSIKESISKSEDKKRIEYEDILTKVDINTDRTDKGTIVDLLQGFKQGYFNDFENWKRLVIILSNNGFSCEEVISYLRKNLPDYTDKYDLENRNLYNSAKTNSVEEYKKITIGTLYFMLKEHNPEYYEEMKKKTKLSQLDYFIMKYEKYTGSKMVEFDEMFLKFLDKEFDRGNINNTNYYLKRDYFLKYNVFLNFNPKVINKKYDPIAKKFDLVYINPGDLQLSHLKFKRKEIDSEGKEKVVEEELIKGIKKDDSFKRYNDIFFYPHGTNEPSLTGNSYNTFEGFAFKKVYEEASPEEVENFKKYLEYIFRFCCEGNFKLFIYFLQWFANIIQNPRNKSGISPVFYSKEKMTGKGNNAKFLVKVIGTNATFTKMDNVLGRFSDNNSDTLLNICDEISASSFSNNDYNKFKSFITEEQLQVEGKYVQQRKTYNFASYISLTNEVNCFKTDSEENRFLYMNFEKVYENFEEWKVILDKVFNEDIYVKLFGELLERLDIPYNTRYEWVSNKPTTRTEHLFKNINIIESFLKELIKGNLQVNSSIAEYNEETGEYKINCENLYVITFKDYLRTMNNTNRHFSFGVFEREIMNIFNNILKKKTIRRVNYWFFNKDQFVDKLMKLKVLEPEDEVNGIYFGGDCLIDDEESVERPSSESKPKINKYFISKCKKEEKKQQTKIETELRKETDKNIELFNEFLNTHF